MGCWELDNVALPHRLFGKAYPPETKTPALWNRWPESWRQHTHPTKLGRLAVGDSFRPEIAARFDASVGRLFTDDEFTLYASAAYDLLLKRRWFVPLPDIKEDQLDTKRAVMSEACCAILAEGAHTKKTFDSFEGFVLCFQSWARNRSKHEIDAGRERERQQKHLRRKRRGAVECPWCWSALEERKIPKSHVCPSCQIGIPFGVTVAFTETVCKRYAANPRIGPGVLLRIEFWDRQRWSQYQGQRPATSRFALPAEISERIERLDRERYPSGVLHHLGHEVPVHATPEELGEVESFVDQYTRRRFEYGERVQGFKKLPSRIDPAAPRKDEDGVTARWCKPRSNKDKEKVGWHEAWAAGIPQSDDEDVSLDEVIPRVARALRRYEAKFREQEAAWLKDSEATPGWRDRRIRWTPTILPKGSPVRTAWLKEKRRLKASRLRRIGPQRPVHPATKADWTALALDSAMDDLLALSEAVEDLRQRLACLKSERRRDLKIARFVHGIRPLRR